MMFIELHSPVRIMGEVGGPCGTVQIRTGQA